MSFWWEPELAADARVSPDALSTAGLDQHFDDQFDAEEWLSENFAELADLGVEALSLIEDGTKIFGPMGLNEA